MKHKIIFACILIGSFRAYAQKNIDGLAKAERNFAAYSVANGMKPAFLEFADSLGILFDQGKPVNAVQLWNSREARPGILNWRPDYIEIAASHDFGYTTGPWTFQTKTLQDTIAGRGRFFTVWQINNKGEWKFLVDIGVSNTPISLDTTLRKIEITDPSNEPGNAASLLTTEHEFILLAKQSMKDAYTKYLSAKTFLTRNGSSSAKTNQEILKVLENSDLSIQFSVDGSGIASSGDMGYVYGTSIFNGKTDNYLRVWRKEKPGWKLALEVLR